MSDTEAMASAPIQLRRFFWALVGCWTVAIGEQMRGAAITLEHHTGVPYKLFGRLTGLAANDELTRFNRVTLGRELRIIELKKQVNELRAQLGQPPRYQTDLDEKARPTP